MPSLNNDALTNGLITVRSFGSVHETVQRLMIALDRRGMIVYAHIDHAKEAAAVNIAIRPTHLFVVGYREAEFSIACAKSASWYRAASKNPRLGRCRWRSFAHLHRSSLARRPLRHERNLFPARSHGRLFGWHCRGGEETVIDCPSPAGESGEQLKRRQGL